MVCVLGSPSEMHARTKGKFGAKNVTSVIRRCAGQLVPFRRARGRLLAVYGLWFCDGAS